MSKQTDTRLSVVTKGRNVQHGVMDIKEIKTHPTFVDLLLAEAGMLETITQSMRVNGYYESQPTVLAVWPGQEEPVLVDGSTRIQAALKAGITHVPFVIVEFESEMEALQHVINLQTQRRITTDGALYRLCDQFDRLMDRGRPRKGEETGKLTTRVVNFVGPSASAKRTAQLIGCNYRKVDRIRKIRRDGTHQIQEAVRNDQLTISKAYKLIRDMELGEDDSGKKSAAARTKAAKTLLNEEQFALLHDVGGHVVDHVNKAVEMYIRWLRDKEQTAELEQGTGSLPELK